MTSMRPSTSGARVNLHKYPSTPSPPPVTSECVAFKWGLGANSASIHHSLPPGVVLRDALGLASHQIAASPQTDHGHPGWALPMNC
jgi:hypothetical protein